MLAFFVNATTKHADFKISITGQIVGTFDGENKYTNAKESPMLQRYFSDGSVTGLREVADFNPGGLI